MAVRRAAIYTRISLDRRGESISPERQETLCRAMAESKDWTVLGEPFADRDKSGWKKGVVRPGFDAMLFAIGAGEVDVVLAYSLSRLGRRTIELLKFAEDLRDRGIGLATVSESIDTSSAMGTLFFTFLAAMAQMESEIISERTKSAYEVGAQAGRAKGGGHRCYGYAWPKDGGGIIKEEADYIEQAVSDITAGVSLRQTCRNLNGDGSRTTTGGEWQPRSLSNLLHNPRLRGIRKHNGIEYEGDWTPILTETEQLTLMDKMSRAHVEAPERILTAHLLSGLVVCGKCGIKMGYGKFTDSSRKAITRYQCRRQPGSKACGSVAIVEASLDRYVERTVIEFASYFARQGVSQLESVSTSRDALQAELDELQDTLNELLSERFSSTGRIAKDIFENLRLPLITRIAAVKEELQNLDVKVTKLQELPYSVRGIPKLKGEISDKRLVLSKALDKIEVMPAAHRGGNKFQTDRIVFTWKDGSRTTSTDLDRISALYEAEADAGIEAWNAMARGEFG